MSSPLFHKFIVSSYLYGLTRGILYNIDRKDKNNQQILITDKLLYTFTSTLCTFPTMMFVCIYYDCRNIELFMKNKKNDMCQDWITSFYFNIKHENKKFYITDQ